MKTTPPRKNHRTPSALFSKITLACIIGTLIAGILVFGLDEHVLLVCCVAIIGVACVILGYSWMRSWTVWSKEQ